MLIVILALVAIVVIESYFLFGKTANTNLNSPSPTPISTQQSTLTPQPNEASTTPSPTPLIAPSTPTFTVTLTNTSYTVPTTYSTDPQTGATVTHPGYFVNQENLTFTIQNQPDTTNYVIRWTTPYATDWTYLEGEDFSIILNATIAQSSGSETVMALSGAYGSFTMYPTNQEVYGYQFSFASLESGASIEFQVQAVNGESETFHMIFTQPTYLIGVASAWSQTQTITIP